MVLGMCTPPKENPGHFREPWAPSPQQEAALLTDPGQGLGGLLSDRQGPCGPSPGGRQALQLLPEGTWPRRLVLQT